MKIAIIGSGITGLSAAWLLHPHHQIVVYEQDGRIGGHSNTVDAPVGPDGASVPVDTGFIVFNGRTYPNLVALFDHLGVLAADTAMSFSVSSRNGALEYAGTSMRHLYAQPRNLLRWRHHRMVRDILDFYRRAPGLLAEMDDDQDSPSLEAFLSAHGYGDGFVYDHLLPMGAAIWSTTVSEMMRFPATSFVRFFHNHGLLQVAGRPQWRTVKGGSRSYVKRLAGSFADRIRTGDGAVEITRAGPCAVVKDSTGHAEIFDQVILACHADQALALLTDATDEERAVLTPFRYEPNKAVLHTDPKLMPRRRRVWSSWNYLSRQPTVDDAKVSVTYWMNRLQPLGTARDVFVTLNPLREPDPRSVIASFDYDHPQFDHAAMLAQKRIGSIQGVNRTWFCGSYCGYGFHEDGLAAGLTVAEALGARRPWSVEEASPAGRHAAPDIPFVPDALRIAAE
ncbi:MAG: FAD-dependent oxidoreductase [Pseudomonadota bacterium]